MKTHDYEKYASEYADLGIEGTDYLSFRDVPKLAQKYVHGTKALDYGCGAGRSTRFLKSLGFDVVGVDISSDMLGQARLKDPNGSYQIIKSSDLPFNEASFDLVFSSYVFLEVSSIAEIEKVFREFRRVLKPTGYCIFITTSEPGYKGDWVSLSYDFPENKREFKTGDTVKLLIRGTNVTFYDYYWTSQDFQGIFARTGLTMRELHQPIGLPTDPIKWRDEAHTPPTSVYILQNTI